MSYFTVFFFFFSYQDFKSCMYFTLTAGLSSVNPLLRAQYPHVASGYTLGQPIWGW